MTNPRITYDEPSGPLDDFMATNVAMVHFEALDQSQWYATVQLDDGQVWQLKFGAKNDQAAGYAFTERVS